MNKSTFFMEKLIRKKSFSDWLTSTSQSINDSVRNCKISDFASYGPFNVYMFSTFFHRRTPGVYMIHDTYPQAEKNILFANITLHCHYI